MQNSKAIQAQIKKLKKWLERDELFYPYKDGDKTYVMVRFTRFGKGRGNVILSENGVVVPRDVAIPIYKQYVIYNTCIVEASRKLDKEIADPIWMFEQTHDLISNVVYPATVRS